jgi:predicted dehydrogenase
MTTHRPSLNLAIFGLGRWGTHLLRNFARLPGANVVALVDPHPERLRRAAIAFICTIRLPATGLGKRRSPILVSMLL